MLEALAELTMALVVMCSGMLLLLIVLHFENEEQQCHRRVFVRYEQRLLHRFPRERLPELLREMPRGFHIQSESHGDGDRYCDVILSKPVWRMI